MRSKTAVVLMILPIHVLAQTPAPAVSPEWAAESAAPRVSDQTIKQAVRETIAEEGAAAPRDAGAAGEAFRSERVDKFSRQFEQARVPGCLRPDGLKHQPTGIFAGLLALPFVAVAAIRGKCR